LKDKQRHQVSWQNECVAGPREQLNQASAYLDGSVVYGTSLKLTSQLRSMSGGKLRMSVTPDGRSLLPYSVDPSDGCNQKEEMARGRYCFISGTGIYRVQACAT